MSPDTRLWYTCVNSISCCAICGGPLTLLFYYTLPELANTFASYHSFASIHQRLLLAVSANHHTAPHHTTGKWIATPATDCDPHCGVVAGSGKEGVVRCSTGKDSGCDPKTKPAPRLCPKPPKCSECLYWHVGINSEQTEGSNG